MTGSSRPGSSRSRGCAPASWCRRRMRPSRCRRSRRARPIRASCRSCCRRARAIRSAIGATGRSMRRPSAPTGRSALHVQGYSGGHPSTGSGWPTYYMQEHYAMCGNMQDDRREPGVRRRVRALPQAQDRADRGRLRLGAGAGLAHGQALGTHAHGDAAPEAPAVRICARALLVHHAADRGAGEPARPRRDHRMGRLGPADVLDRLSALGLRRSAPRLQVPADAKRSEAMIFRDNAKALYGLQ